jgi:hypothetical protein
MVKPANHSYTFVVVLPKNNVATLDYRDERSLLKLKQQQNSHATTQKVTYFRGLTPPQKVECGQTYRKKAEKAESVYEPRLSGRKKSSL